MKRMAGSKLGAQGCSCQQTLLTKFCVSIATNSSIAMYSLFSEQNCILVARSRSSSFGVVQGGRWGRNFDPRRSRLRYQYGALGASKKGAFDASACGSFSTLEYVLAASSESSDTLLSAKTNSLSNLSLKKRNAPFPRKLSIPFSKSTVLSSGTSISTSKR